MIDDIFHSRPVIYTTFLAYDEVAHHSGIEREDTLAVLAKVDRQLGRVRAAAEVASHEYRLVVLSDHGQSQGATFLQRYGESLEDLVTAACEARDTHVDAGREDDAVSYLSAGLTELSRDETATARVVRRATGAEPGEVVELGDDGDEAESGEAGGARGLGDGVGVPGAGQLPARAGPAHPGAPRGALSAAGHRVSEHPGIGFVLVRSASTAPWPFGRGGINYLDRGEVEERTPWRGSGPTPPATCGGRIRSPTARTWS